MDTDDLFDPDDVERIVAGYVESEHHRQQIYDEAIGAAKALREYAVGIAQAGLLGVGCGPLWDEADDLLESYASKPEVWREMAVRLAQDGAEKEAKWRLAELAQVGNVRDVIEVIREGAKR